MNEQISALIDDEIALEDAAHLMAAMQSNGHAAEAWSHYHLIGDAMRGAATLSPGFKQKLMQKIELEPTALSPNAALINQGQVDTTQAGAQTLAVKSKLPATWSIAASLAAVTMVGYMVLQTQVSNDGAPVQVAQAENAQTAANLAVATEVTIPAEYLMAHQASAPTGSSYYIQAASYAK